MALRRNLWTNILKCMRVYGELCMTQAHSRNVADPD